MSITLIDSVDSVDKESLTFDKLKFLYGTGRSTTIITAHEKITKYRHGAMTKIGDIEVSVWAELVRFMILKEGETELYNNLLNWINDNQLGNMSQSEREMYALQLHAARIFDDCDWVGYANFNANYRTNKKN